MYEKIFIDRKVSGFLIADSMIGLLIISIAISLFCFNQSCFSKLENELYLTNLKAQQAYTESIQNVNKSQQINQIKIQDKQGSFLIYVK